ncbi:hypothetical protein [Leadbetterella sp. DM7]|uniref:hypothetical protein n=1 Tax=Leadbetterella sp. DM7 TaxID=3235085 RepID=UPI00349EF310
MKKLWLTVLLSPLFLMCRHNGHGGLHITEKVTDDLVYEFTADYPDSETGTVQNILSRHLKDAGMSFVNAELDADMGFDNGMFFYIRSRPGFLEIVCERSKNSEENYLRIQKMCKAVKNSLED